MAHDVALADRVRVAVQGAGELREQRMFGGLAFLVDHAMVVCVSTGGGALLVRVPPARDADLLSRPGARRAEMGAGRSMGTGWIAVDSDAVADEEHLASWVAVALEHRAAQRWTRTTRNHAGRAPGP